MLKELYFSKCRLAATSLIVVLVTSIAKAPSHDQIVAIASPLATIAGILFGFVIGATTFISSASSSSELISNMKANNQYGALLSQLSSTGLALIVSCIFMVFCIFLPPTLVIDLSWGTIDSIMLLLGFFFLIYGLFDFLSVWLIVNRVAHLM